MTGHTHSPAEWAEMVSLAFGIWGTCSVFYFLLVDADRADFNPRPALETGRLAPAWQVAVHAGHDLNRAVATAERLATQATREAALTAAALLALLLPAAGSTR